MYQPSNHVQQNHHPPLPNGHHTHQPNGHHPQPGPSHRTAPAKEPLRVLGIPSVSVSNNQIIHGDAQSSSERAYTPIKIVGDGSFGTVWLVDWHSALPPNTPLSAMQCGAGARPEWANKRLVALKRMKKRWEGGWDECRKLKELESLRAIPFHANIIPLYDFFLLPSTKELYFVFESMEGNLYQLIKSRKGRPLAGGLVSCIFRQVVAGLHHIHAHGYFHRDMKPENLLVTTTGLFDYRNVSPIAPPNAPPEKDVVVIVKLADFGLARETKSRPPYTEYVSTRWYRAPEVLLRSRDYSNPVDMWALGTIMAELINLKPLFPGSTEIDQVARICEILGDPSDEYGVDTRGMSIGGGKWVKGVKMARSVGYTFPKLKPVSIYSLFDRNVPISIIECISDLLKYDPDMRLNCQRCLEHPYILETTPGNIPPGPQVPLQLRVNVQKTMIKPPNLRAPANSSNMNSISPRTVPPSHSNSPANGKPIFNGPHPQVPHPHPHPQPNSHSLPPLSHPQPQPALLHRVPFYPQSMDQSMAGPSRLVASPDMMVQMDGHMSHPSGDSTYSTAGDRISESWTNESTHVDHIAWDAMDVSPSPAPQERPRSSDQVQPMEITVNPPEDLSKHIVNHDQGPSLGSTSAQHSMPGSKLRIGLGFGKKSSKWGLSGMFGHGERSQNVLPPVDELAVPPTMSTPSLKRIQSSSSDSHSLSEISPVGEPIVDDPPTAPMDAKQRKKEAERIALEAEKARRALAEKRSREQARSVMQKRNQMLKQQKGSHIEWENTTSATLIAAHKSKPKQRSNAAQASSSSATVQAAGGVFRSSNDGKNGPEYDNYREVEHRTKARRRDLDDDHSMSSSDLQSARVSVMSFATAATVESDPSSSRLRHRPSLFGIARMQSNSSLQTSIGDDYSISARSSTNSPSFEHQLGSDFDSRNSMSSYARSSISDASSPLPIHALSLSSPQQQTQMLRGQTYITLPPPIPSMQHHLRVGTPSSPYEYGQYGQIQAEPPSPAIAPHSAINPIFKVPPLPSQPEEIQILPLSPQNTLPPFSHLESIAEPLPP